jgi:hypothetical protein
VADAAGALPQQVQDLTLPHEHDFIFSQLQR